MKMNKKEYQEKNEAFMREVAMREGVLPLPSGLYYEVVESGDGPSPSLSSVVTVFYRGMLIDGKVFDDNMSQGYPDAFRLTELISGWQIALTRMKAGDYWRIYVPSKHGYGNRGTDGIPCNSTLIFEIRLVGVA